MSEDKKNERSVTVKIPAPNSSKSPLYNLFRKGGMSAVKKAAKENSK